MGYFEMIYRSELSHRARAVYMYLKDHADKDGQCWPGIRTIAAELKLSRSTVKRALDDLCKAGLIAKSRAGGRTEASVPICTGSSEHRNGLSRQGESPRIL